MKRLVHPYVCNECKKVIDEASDLLFVEEGSSRGFCSEECIEDFYTPYMNFFEKKVLDIRTELNLVDEVVENFDNDQLLVDEVAANPDQIYKSQNELKEEIYIYIKYHHGFYSVVICTVFNETPSFIFSLVKTKSKRLVEALTFGEQQDIRTMAISEEAIVEDTQFIELLESKKSHLLGDILSQRKDSDIPFEDFNLYDSYLEETLTNPDEIFEKKDREGDRLTHFLKSFVDKKYGSFFYVVIGMKKVTNQESGEELFYPILSFPTNDMGLFKDFRVGERIHGLIKN